MGRFESPLQVLALFSVASLVSVGIIFFVNAEARNRLNSRNNELPDSTVETNDDGAPLSLPLSSSRFFSSSSSELTSSYATDSNYTSSSSSPSSSSFTSSSLGLGLERGATNVTLLNFLEDGLEKLLSLIKQAKNTYKSYYLHNGPSHNDEDRETTTISPSGLHHPRRRKKREATVMDSGIKHLGGDSDSKSRSSSKSTKETRSKRAVISPNKRRRIGENEPYYWQMLEDNNSENHHHHSHHLHSRDKDEQQRERENRRQKQAPSEYGGSSSPSQQQQAVRGHQSNSQYPHYSPHHNHQSQKEMTVAGESHYFGSSIVPGSGQQAPAVASAFTGGAETMMHSVHNPTSDFHKIRHAMNKLGGLDLSVVERMILDTKSSGRSHSSSMPARDPPQHLNRMRNNNPPPVPGNGKDMIMKSREDDESHAPPSSSLLTTAITKTTQQGRQDESLYVNQLRHHQQQLAQSLLPPTVTWLGEGGDGSAVRYLPLPSSSLATGARDFGEDDDDDDIDNEDGNDHDGEEGNNSQEGGGGDDDDDNNNDGRDNEGDSDENSVSGKRRGKENTKKKMKRKKSEKAQKRKNNNELSYSSNPSMSSSNSNEADEEEGDYHQVPNGKRDRDRDDDSSDGNNNSRNSDSSRSGSGSNGSSGDNNSNTYMDSIIEEEEEEEIGGLELEEEEQRRREEEELLLEGNPPTPHHTADDDGNENGGKSHNGKDCYHTDDVLIVVAITCCLNFAFVLVIWALVRWFSISSNPKEKDFQNLGDCDDTLDPTIVFHGVTEDPCWTLAKAESAGVGGGGGGSHHKDDRSTSGTMTTTRSNNLSSGVGGTNYMPCGSSSGVGGTGMNGGMMIGSVHSVHKTDLFPTMGRYVGGGGGGGGGCSSTGSSAILHGAPVMTMTAERRLPYHSNLHIGSGGMIGFPGSTAMITTGANIYSFKPEHVPAHHGSSGTMHRSYSQSMEDLRYIQ